MPREFNRTERVAEQLKRDLAVLIRDEVKDPRVGMVTVAAVEISRDFSHAKVYITVLGDTGIPEESVTILNRAGGYLRGRLGKLLAMRTIPALHFLYDVSQTRGADLSALIDSAVRKDREQHEAVAIADKSQESE
ncbi:MAG: ribosome-binding factor A [Gammaproteobacteria bacterium]|nr:MAG: ribosome-binding factor A [Gammaproteobacteria bacterium]TND06913.1 MAG: ribosome-binding factor A [Gammaproteobacteria bacterium]